MVDIQEVDRHTQIQLAEERLKREEEARKNAERLSKNLVDAANKAISDKAKADEVAAKHAEMVRQKIADQQAQQSTPIQNDAAYAQSKVALDEANKRLAEAYENQSATDGQSMQNYSAAKAAQKLAQQQYNYAQQNARQKSGEYGQKIDQLTVIDPFRMAPEELGVLD